MEQPILTQDELNQASSGGTSPILLDSESEYAFAPIRGEDDVGLEMDSRNRATSGTAAEDMHEDVGNDEGREDEDAEHGGDEDVEGSDDDDDDDGESEDEGSEEVSTEFPVKRRGRDMGRQPLKLCKVKHQQDRTRRTRGYLKTLRRKAEFFKIRSGGKVFLKWQYETGNRTFNEGTYGENFLLTNEIPPPTPPVSDMTAFAEMAKKSMLEALKARDEEKQDATALSNLDAFSPGKRRDVAVTGHTCDACHESVKYVRGREIPSPWIGCEGDDREKECLYGWIHACCAGFPIKTAEDAERLPKYFCAKHRDFGALKSIEPEVSHYFVALPIPQVSGSETPAAPASSTVFSRTSSAAGTSTSDFGLGSSGPSTSLPRAGRRSLAPKSSSSVTSTRGSKARGHKRK